MVSNEFRFFAKMRVKAADNCLSAGFAVANLVFKAVDTAFTGTNRTGSEVVDLFFHRTGYKFVLNYTTRPPQSNKIS